MRIFFIFFIIRFCPTIPFLVIFSMSAKLNRSTLKKLLYFLTMLTTLSNYANLVFINALMNQYLPSKFLQIADLDKKRQPLLIRNFTNVSNETVRLVVHEFLLMILMFKFLRLLRHIISHQYNKRQLEKWIFYEIIDFGCA